MRGIFLNPSEHVRHAYVAAKNQGFCIGAFLACAHLFLSLSDSAVKIMDSPQHYTLFFLFPVLALPPNCPTPSFGPAWAASSNCPAGRRELCWE